MAAARRKLFQKTSSLPSSEQQCLIERLFIKCNMGELTGNAICEVDPCI